VRKVLIGLSLVAIMSIAHATPTYAQIDAAMAQHDYMNARVMLSEVLRKRPEAVRAHAINVNLMIAEKASQRDVEAEQKITQGLISSPSIPQIIVPAQNIGWLRGLLALLLVVILGGGTFLGNEWRLAHGRKKQKDIDESYASNYTQQLSSHNK
jgi:hypothetical protein